MSIQALGLGLSIKEMAHAQVAALEQRVQELEAELAKYKNPGGNSNEDNKQEPPNVITITTLVFVRDTHFTELFDILL